MKALEYSEVENTPAFWGVVAVLGVLAAIGVGAALYMEHHGHIVTGMNNQVVWGLPHVFAVFLIVAASGALNVASIGTVFGKYVYKPLGRISATVAMALLGGGLMVLMLDLGRPDRFIVAATTYNFKSVFAWNVVLYSGFFGFTAAYVWTMMDPTAKCANKPAGFMAFIWRLVLTTGTGSIFGFIVARDLFHSAIYAPMFIAMSFSYGLAVFNIVVLSTFGAGRRELGDKIVNKLARLQGIFIAASLFFVLALHMTKLYYTRNHGAEFFILMDGGIYTAMFWVGQVVLGSLIPLAMVLMPGVKSSRGSLLAASVLVILGGLAQMYATIIGGQVWPLNIFPGYEVSSSFFDGVVASYSPSLPEFLLGLGGMAVAFLLTAVAARVLRLMPDGLADADVDPYHATKS